MLRVMMRAYNRVSISPEGQVRYPFLKKCHLHGNVNDVKKLARRREWGCGEVWWRRAHVEVVREASGRWHVAVPKKACASVASERTRNLR